MATFTFKHGDRPLEGYAIQRAVGRGGFGEVYYAISDGGREVALKYLRENPAVELRGVSHCMNLKSPHLVTIFDVRHNPQGDYFIVMEYVQGPSLRDLLIAEPNGLGPQKSAFFVRELAKGLSYLHERGIVHRDLKPGNIFYEDGYVKIGDYGLSKFISVSRHSAQTSSVGTVHYMAPEVGSGHYHRGIDIYALGVMLYEMLLGRVPFDGATMGEVLMKHLTAQPVVDQLPEPFARVIRKALAKDPKDRYQTVDEMAEEILGVAEVQDSLVGFNPHSLTSVARHLYEPIESPVRSPNPPPPLPPPVREVPRRLGRRFDRVGEKVARRLAHLERKYGRRPGQPQAAGSLPLGTEGQRGKHAVVAILLVLGLATGLSVLMGLIGQQEELAVSAGLGVAAMTAGVLVARRAIFWLGQAAQPIWVHRLVTLGCCSPLLAMAMAPVMDQYRGGPGALLGLIITAMFVDWESRLESGAAGEMKARKAFGAALCAFICTAIPASWLGGREHLMFLAAGVAGVTSFALQGVAWFVGLRGLPVRPRSTGKRREAAGTPLTVPGVPATEGLDAVGDDLECSPAEALGRVRSVGAEGTPGGMPKRSGTQWSEAQACIKPEDATCPRVAEATLGHATLPPMRHVITRAFWSLVGFGLLAGAVVSFLSTRLLTDVRLNPEDRQAALTVCAVCCAFLAFALRKVSLRKRPTFWQETLRPFLLALSSIGIVAPLIALKVRPDLRFDDESRLVCFSFLILSGVLFAVLLVARGRRRHAPATMGAPPPPEVGDGRADALPSPRVGDGGPPNEPAGPTDNRSVEKAASQTKRTKVSIILAIAAVALVILGAVMFQARSTNHTQAIIIERPAPPARTRPPMPPEPALRLEPAPFAPDGGKGEESPGDSVFETKKLKQDSFYGQITFRDGKTVKYTWLRTSGYGMEKIPYSKELSYHEDAHSLGKFDLTKVSRIEFVNEWCGFDLAGKKVSEYARMNNWVYKTNVTFRDGTVWGDIYVYGSAWIWKNDKEEGDIVKAESITINPR